MTGRDSKSAMKPNLATDAITASSPTSRASALAKAAYRAESPAASGPIAAAVISAVDDSGPIDSDRDDPSRA